MRCLFALLSAVFFLVPGPALSRVNKTADIPYSHERNQQIARIAGLLLTERHFSQEKIDENLAGKIFDLYLRQLDPRKRFFMQADIRKLEAAQAYIAPELRSCEVHLPDVGRELLDARIKEVDALIDPILDEGFDFTRKETLESDPKKFQFTQNDADLRERWRLTLKMQALDSFFEALEAKRKKEPEKYKEINPEAYPELMTEAMDKVRNSSHRAMQRLLKQTRQDHYDRYFDAVARAFDPHSSYMPPMSKEDFDIQMSGSLEGIGAVLREDEGFIKVVRIMPGSPAMRQGQLEAEDIILTVAEKDEEPVDITEMRLREAVNLIRGPKNTEVFLGIRKPDGGKINIAIVRDVVQLEETYAKSALLHTKEGKAIGYIRIPGFYRDFSADGEGRNATDDTRALITQLKQDGIEGLILDLRNNGGGALDDAIGISGLFLPSGPIVQVKNGDGEIEVRRDEDEQIEYDGLLIVLVNQFSASASEILAAAMQDYSRALIIGGRHTHGKGTVQAMHDLNEGWRPFFQLRKKIHELGALKLTVQKFYRINGGSTQFRGVTPDVIVPSMLDYLESGEQYMDYALPWDQVAPAPYQVWQGDMFDREKARAEGQAWIATSQKFQKISAESEKVKLRAQRTMVTVAAADMWRERQELAQMRQEAKAAGLEEALDEEDDGEGNGGETKEGEEKPEAKLAIDPYVQLSLELFARAQRKAFPEAAAP